ncbi:hypothetical protein AVEN_72520-1 [Araneus ventricosus]|uniref:Uncharacterized protein n=1 Tax=Araneus ventricosus TaxID=182803 RepID=A0A4Y2QXS0_ARAVE|nr:hypothetical protein AVEN_72520-1 [Araneus ventricosus]
MKVLENARIMALSLLGNEIWRFSAEFHVTSCPVGKVYKPEVLKRVNRFGVLFVVRVGQLLDIALTMRIQLEQKSDLPRQLQFLCTSTSAADILCDRIESGENFRVLQVELTVTFLPNPFSGSLYCQASAGSIRLSKL